MASDSKRKRNVLNIETKLEILNRLAEEESGASPAQFYNVGKSAISDIKKCRETILNVASKLDSEDGSKKRKTMRESNDVVFDCALYLWFSQRRMSSYCMDRIRFSVIPTIPYPNGVWSQLIRKNDVLLYLIPSVARAL
ncbi:jerky-like protein [Trichonephila clavipes]|nr:jerky-like protein [Trichonephila clavipes]